MIQVSGLTKIFSSGTKALDELDLNVKDGEIFALLGPNGAGKTTTIRILSTLSGFDAGQVIVASHDVDRNPEKVRESIGVVAQQTGIDYFLTGRENLMLQGHLYRMKKADIQVRVRELAHYFELEDSLDRLVTTYSGGMRRKLDIATALIHRPTLVFLDEPTLGLDIKSRKNLWAYVEKMNRDLGLTILLTTHYLEEADKLAHRVAIINAGKIRITGTPEDLKNAIHGDAVVLSFEQQDHTTAAFAYTMKNEPEIKDTRWQGNKLHLYVANGAESIPKIALIASQQGLTIKTLALSRPTLDDVFLKYTGSSLTEAKEETGDEWWKQWAGKGGGNWNKKWANDEEAPGGKDDPAQWTQEDAGSVTRQETPEHMHTTTHNTTSPAQPAAPDTNQQGNQYNAHQDNTGKSTQQPSTPTVETPAKGSGESPWSAEEMEAWWKKQGGQPQWPASDGEWNSPSKTTPEKKD